MRTIEDISSGDKIFFSPLTSDNIDFGEFVPVDNVGVAATMVPYADGASESESDDEEELDVDAVSDVEPSRPRISQPPDGIKCSAGAVASIARSHEVARLATGATPKTSSRWTSGTHKMLTVFAKIACH